MSLKNQNEESLRQFEKLVWGWEQVRECYMLNGEVDFILKCVSKNMEEFNNFLTNQLHLMKIFLVLKLHLPLKILNH